MSFSGAFPAAQSVIAIAGDPAHWQKEKTTFQALKSCFLFSPSRHPCEQPVSFSGAFPAAQSVIAIAGDPSNWPKKKQLQALKSCFLFSPSRHPCEQPVSFSGAFPAAQSVIAIAGDPSNWPKKNNFSGPEKLFPTCQVRAVRFYVSTRPSPPPPSSPPPSPLLLLAGKSRAKYKRQLAKPEHARLLGTASCGFSAPEEGVIVSTILDEMSPPKRSKT